MRALQCFARSDMAWLFRIAWNDGGVGKFERSLEGSPAKAVSRDQLCSAGGYDCLTARSIIVIPAKPQGRPASEGKMSAQLIHLADSLRTPTCSDVTSATERAHHLQTQIKSRQIGAWFPGQLTGKLQSLRCHRWGTICMRINHILKFFLPYFLINQPPSRWGANLHIPTALKSARGLRLWCVGMCSKRHAAGMRYVVCPHDARQWNFPTRPLSTIRSATIGFQLGDLAVFVDIFLEHAGQQQCDLYQAQLARIDRL